MPTQSYWNDQWMANCTQQSKGQTDCRLAIAYSPMLACVLLAEKDAVGHVSYFLANCSAISIRHFQHKRAFKIILKGWIRHYPSVFRQGFRRPRNDAFGNDAYCWLHVNKANWWYIREIVSYTRHTSVCALPRSMHATTNNRTSFVHGTKNSELLFI